MAFWQKDLGFVVGNTTVRMPLQLWINDGLMAVFFYGVGLEVKREFVTGEPREFKHAVMPLAGATELHHSANTFFHAGRPLGKPGRALRQASPDGTLCRGYAVTA
ncbi:MAG: Na+/H+ antiporter NhaA [Deltaproteobacteria bacterium]|nr:Na+/H+ antiporter NhaA [Deltaproteobacteria bacterium]